MPRKITLISLVLILLLCSACADTNSAPTETIEVFYDFPVFTGDLSEIISDSNIIVLGSVEKTLPAVKATEDTAYTPADIKVIQSLKGEYKNGDIFKIYQNGGVVGGIDYEEHPVYFHKDGETYLFFIGDEKGFIVHSEHVVNGKISEGYFFDGITTDEAASIIEDCVKTGRIETDINEIGSFSFTRGITGESFLTYSVDKNKLEVQRLTEYNVPINTGKWDIAKWGSFISDLEKCGVFDWKNNYGNTANQGDPYWSVEFDYQLKYMGKTIFEGTNAYPDGWDSFMKIIDGYFGSLK